MTRKSFKGRSSAPFKYKFRLVFFLIAYMVSLDVVFGQNSMYCKGFWDQEPSPRFFESYIGEYDGGHYFCEFLSPDKEGYTTLGSYANHTLSIRILRGKTMRLLNRRNFNDISVGFTKSRYKYLSSVLMSDVLKVLVFDRLTGSIGFLKLDILSLEIRKGWEEIYSLTELYGISLDALNKEISSNGLIIRSKEANSDNRSYSSILVYCCQGWGLDKYGTLMSILINEESNLEHSVSFKIPSENPNRFSAVSNVSNGGSVIIFGQGYSIAEDGHGYGNTLRILTKEGQETFFDELKIANSPIDHSGHFFPLTMRVKGQKIYLAGFDNSNEGFLTGVFNISSLNEDHTLQFHPFTAETKAQYLQYEDKEVLKMTQRFEKKKKTIEYISPLALTVLADSSFAFTSSQVFAADYSRRRFEMTRVMVSKFNGLGQPEFSKVTHVDYSSIWLKDLMVYPAPYEINGELALFINCEYNNINGYGMIDHNPGTSTQGGIVWIKQDGKNWRKEPYRCQVSSNTLLVFPNRGIRLSESTWLFPSQPYYSSNVGYSRLEF